MSSFYKIAVFALVVTLVFFVLNYSQDTNDMEITSITIGNNDLSIEVVNSPDAIRQGLSDRDEIGSDGMLFIFPNESIKTFWMLNMRFDLDFVWINGGEVVGITKNVEKPKIGIKNKDLKIISPSKPADKVLELNAGDVDRYEIKVGDVVILK